MSEDEAETLDPELLIQAGIQLFNDGLYLAAHEVFEELWEATEAAEADFFKGLIQAAIALHHLEQGNHAGANKLLRGHRRFLAAFLPHHRGVDVAAFLEAMQRTFDTPWTADVGETEQRLPPELRPRLTLEKTDPSGNH